MSHRIRTSFCCILCIWLALGASVLALAEQPVATTERVDFVYQNLVLRHKKVSFYKDVLAYNHTEYLVQPFDSVVPERFFVSDGDGGYALAPIVMDVADAVRIALYGEDVGKVALFYGQYTEKVRSSNKRWGYSGIHEGLDFIASDKHPLYAILDGEVLRNGRNKDGAVAIYNAQYNTTVLYLHVENVSVKIGDIITAGTLIGTEGEKGSGGPYTHIEVRFGRRTSPTPYRNVTLESDLPYDFFSMALDVAPSGREPVTAAMINEEKRQRLAAEAQAEEARKAAEAEAEAARFAAESEAEAARLAAEAEAEAARQAEEAARLGVEISRKAADATFEAVRIFIDAEAQRLANPTPAPTPEIQLQDAPSEDIPDDFGF